MKLARRFVRGVCGVGLVLSWAIGAQAGTVAVDGAAAAAKALPCTVTIEVTDESGNVIDKGAGAVTGTFKDSLEVTTCAHVVPAGYVVWVIHQESGFRCRARVVGIDPDGAMVRSERPAWDKLKAAAGSDLALLRIPRHPALHPADVSRSTLVPVGEAVMAIGNPAGIGNTVSIGNVSSQLRHMYGVWYTVCASLSPGNSGGGLFDMQGRLVGINTLKHTGPNVEGVGFALPVADVLRINAELRRSGTVRRAFLGVDIGQALAGGRQTLVVQAVIPGSPAERAGIRVGDVVVAVDGLRTETKDQLFHFWKRLVQGQDTVWLVERGGTQLKLAIHAEGLPGRGAPEDMSSGE